MCTSLRWTAFLLLFVVAVGCSKGGPTIVPVSGKLTANGKPLKNVKVDFHPDPDNGNTGAGSSGSTDEEGNFSLLYSATGTDAGAIAGHHRVIFTDLDIYGTVFVGRGAYRADDGKGAPAEVPKKSRIPAEYSDLSKTPVKQEVKEGMGPVTIDIQLGK